jgi:choline dehydrogenase-like flavoprotein
MARRPDVVVVGAGACGILAAKLLTAARRNVLLLESGPDVRTAREPAAVHQPIQSTCWRCSGELAQLFVDDDRHPYSWEGESPFHWIRGRQLGGRMIAWSGSAVRMTDTDFNPSVPDHPRWPLRYADLTRYYDVAEQALAVRAACTIDERTGRYLSSCSEALPGAAARFRACVESRWPERQVLSRPSSLEADASWTAGVRDMPVFRILEDAERSGRLTLRPHVTVTRIEVDQSTGLASAVLACDSITGAPLRFDAPLVLFCASAIETARLLLHSRSPRHPAGLGNHAGVLGRFLMDHVTGVQLTARRAATDEGPDYYHPIFIPRYRNVTTRADGFTGGYWWQGFAYRDTEEQGPFDFIKLSAFGEVEPRETNRVRLSDDQRDVHGMPAVHIAYALSQNEHNMLPDMIATGHDMLEAAGFDVVKAATSYWASGSSIHEVGTARMGADPESSVVNRHNQIWGCDNVYVSDGSVFVTAGSANPTLTMMALTARACDHIL